MKHSVAIGLVTAVGALLSFQSHAVGLYQAVVSSNPKAGEYSSIKDALQNAPEDKSTYSVYIKPGLYNEQITIDRDNVHLIGA